MRRWRGVVRLWWRSLMQPETAGTVVLDMSGARSRELVTFLLAAVFVLYAIYGVSMGLFRGAFPAFVSALKLPFLYLLTLAVCFPPFYIVNCVVGPRMKMSSCLRLLLLAASANAVAVCSYAPISYFFTLTTANTGYSFLVLMHVAVLAVAGTASVAVGIVVFRAASAGSGRGFGPLAVAAWGAVYGLVGSQMAWALRPWIASPDIAYVPLRGVEGSFVEGVWRLMTQ